MPFGTLKVPINTPKVPNANPTFEFKSVLDSFFEPGFAIRRVFNLYSKN